MLNSNDQFCTDHNGTIEVPVDGLSSNGFVNALLIDFFSFTETVPDCCEFRQMG